MNDPISKKMIELASEHVSEFLQMEGIEKNMADGAVKADLVSYMIFVLSSEKNVSDKVINEIWEWTGYKFSLKSLGMHCHDEEYISGEFESQALTTMNVSIDIDNKNWNSGERDGKLCIGAILCNVYIQAGKDLINAIGYEDEEVMYRYKSYCTAICRYISDYDKLYGSHQTDVPDAPIKSGITAPRKR